MQELSSCHRTSFMSFSRSVASLISEQYCSKACQTTHWNIHKLDCKSPLKQTDWQPQWVQQHRNPAFMIDGPAVQMAFGRNKYLWGNMPSIDVVRLEHNEGMAYNQDLKILFAGMKSQCFYLVAATNALHSFWRPSQCYQNSRLSAPILHWKIFNRDQRH
jgi:hypothetical protein